MSCNTQVCCVCVCVYVQVYYYGCVLFVNIRVGAMGRGTENWYSNTYIIGLENLILLLCPIPTHSFYILECVVSMHRVDGLLRRP